MPRRNVREGFVLLFLIAGGLLAMNCSDDTVPRSIVTLDSINNNESLDSDVYNNGDDGEPGTNDDTIFEDQVPIVVRNRVHDSALDIRANGTYGAVIFNRYEVRFQGTESLPMISSSLHLKVNSGASATGEVTIVPASYKTVLPLIALRQGGEILLNAEVTLYGEEEDSHDEVIVKGILPVHCANWGDPS
jgi:hypothetical protein